MKKRFVRFTLAVTISGLSIAVSGIADTQVAQANTATAHLGASNQNIRLTVNGRREIGHALSASLSGVPDGAEVHFQWFRNGATLQGATNRGRGITLRDVGQDLMVRATIIRAGQPNIVLRSSVTIRDVVIEQIFEATNAARAEHGLPPLTRNNILDNAARTHSADMARVSIMSHTGSDGSAPSDRVLTATMQSGTSLEWFTLAENVITSSRAESGQRLVSSWMNSPGHRANILNPNVNTIGIGVARDATGQLFGTQVFAGIR